MDMKYLYDGENVVYELWGNKTVRFTHPVASGGGCGSGCSGGGCAGGSDIFFTDHPTSISIDGVKYYYLYDGLGSVTELIDVNENVVNVYRYTPIGDALIREETVYNPHQFTGRQYDAESGLYHYRARAYSADIGRFMQQDPAGMVDGANVYVYVGNNPTNNVDPSGMWCIPCFIKSGFWWKLGCYKINNVKLSNCLGYRTGMNNQMIALCVYAIASICFKVCLGGLLTAWATGGSSLLPCLYCIIAWCGLTIFLLTTCFLQASYCG